MKLKININLIALFICILLMTSCKTESDTAKDTQPPEPISDVTFTPDYGGGYFKFTIPADPDYLYARAEYVTDAGKTISKTSSIYSDSLVIEGMGTVKEYEVKLYAVDHDANESEPVIMNVTPLEPTVTAVFKSLDIYAGFSAIVLTLENPNEQPVDIYVNIKGNDSEALKVFSSNKKEERTFIEGLEAVPYEISAYIVDHYDNKTDIKNFGSITPLTDYELDKSTFSFLRDQRLYGDKWDYSEIDWKNQKPYEQWMSIYTADSMKNARESAYEGNIAKFWDGLTDEDPSYSLNYFHTGSQTYPFSYFIDLGREVRVSRMRLWQRSSNAWAGEQVKTCQIFISNDPNPDDGILDDWEYVGEYTINKPANSADADKELKEGSEFWMYPEDPKFTRPFRYLRYKAITQMSNGTSGCMSEITLYGEEVK